MGVCDHERDKVSPFGDFARVISVGYVLIGMITIPFTLLNLDQQTTLNRVAAATSGTVIIVWFILFLTFTRLFPLQTKKN